MNDSNPIGPDYGLPPAAMDPVMPQNEQRLSAEEVHRIRSSAGWFFWIAALSIVNSVMAHTGSQFGFVIGLGFTQAADAVFAGTGNVGTVIALLVDLAAASAFVAFGVLSRMFKMWAFIVGMTLYGFDTLLVLLAADYLSVAFHVFALVSIFLGFNVLRKSKS